MRCMSTPYRCCERLQLVFLTESVCHCTNALGFYRVHSCLFVIYLVFILRISPLLFWPINDYTHSIFFKCVPDTQPSTGIPFDFDHFLFFTTLNELCNMINNITAVWHLGVSAVRFDVFMLATIRTCFLVSQHLSLVLHPGFIFFEKGNISHSDLSWPSRSYL